MFGLGFYNSTVSTKVLQCCCILILALTNPLYSSSSYPAAFASPCLLITLFSSGGRIIRLFLVRFFSLEWLSRVRSIQTFCYSCYQCLLSLFSCLYWILDHISNLSSLQQQAYKVWQNIISQFWMIVSYSASWHMIKLPRNYHNIGRTS